MMDSAAAFDRTGGARSASPAPAPPPRPAPPTAAGRPASLLDAVGAGGGGAGAAQAHIVRVVVCRDERGYGMKVSGDNPVYVQSVKEGGAAEKAGLHAGDKIIKVNGVNVMQSTHTQVVALIRSSSQVVLTVQQRSPNLRPMTPSMHTRPAITPNSARITGPQPVDHETQHQLHQEREQYYRLMIEQEQTHLNVLRGQLALDPDDERKAADLVKTERNLHTLQAMLLRSRNEQSPAPPDAAPFPTPRPLSPNNNTAGGDAPPPLPRRNHRRTIGHSPSAVGHARSPARHAPYSPGPAPRRPRPLPSTPPADANRAFLAHEVNANAAERAAPSPPSPPPQPPQPPAPPPLPPRKDDASNSLDRQMSYPLVATLVSVVDNSDAPNPTHQRTKSSPETLSALPAAADGGAGAAVARKHSESLNDLSKEWEGSETTPPGTPPPPYPSSPGAQRRDLAHGAGDDADDRHVDEHFVDGSTPDVSPFGVNMSGRILANSSPIHAANPQMVQQHIISMEDDEISDQEISQLEDHGYFKSLSRLWEHLPHLAVFTNYILSNSDPNSLLFYLLTDLYKEGNAREMRKWAFEIHSSFLVPGAPLHLGNVGEDVATEIDEVLLRDFDKEEILRKIFWKARARAKEELARQLVEFQQKRTAGLGTIYGPTDQELAEIYNDKVREAKLYENLFLSKLEPYLEELDKETVDTRRYYTAAALTTVITRVFQVSPKGHLLEKCPTFVSKEKSFRTKLIARYQKKLTVLGHQFVAQPYYSVIACNNCHQIIYGISPQGYQCSACLINLHRTCVKLYDDTCPGPIKPKDSRIRKFIRMSHDSNDHNRIKKTSNFLQMEKERRQLEDSRDSSFELNESGLTKSLTHFDFRLTRQTSNLERVRPKATRVSIDGGELEPSANAAKPVLAKAKSSSAINLNLLRTRRTKILEQVAARRQAAAAMNVKDEFDFIAFGSMGKLTGSTTSLNKFPSWLHINKVAEEKGQDEADSSRPGQPVSRSGSDRRPDSVKEEGGRTEGAAAAPCAAPDLAQDVDAVKEVATVDSSVSLPASGNRRKVGSNINRSESWKESSEKRKQKRNISDPSHNASGDVDLERQGLTNTDSGSSSHSSLSCNGRLSESPSSNSFAGEQLARVRSLSDTETDLDDGEAEPLNWQERVPEEELKKLDQQELKRQDVINELFSTESSHVRNLKVLYHVFYKRLAKSTTLKPDELNLIFPNLKEVLDLHATASDEMRRKRRDDPIVRELGELLVRMFCGTQGEELKRASALFCERQRLALELITKRRERDSKFESALAECEKRRQCRRLPLQGILPTQMQRLSKYPLLLERLIGVAGTDEDELRRLRRAHDASKEILQAVNEAAKVAMNRHRLEDIQKRLDTSAFERADHIIVGEFKNLDLTRYKLILEGGMQLRRPNKGIVPVHVLLLEEMVVILHREGDRFTLKFFRSDTPAAPQPLSPIIRMNTLLVRYNAVSKDALFLVNTATSNCQMYDLIAENESKREEWFRNFSEAADVYNRREGGKPARHKAAGAGAAATAAPASASAAAAAPSPPVEEPAPSSGDETVRELPEGGADEPGRAEPAVEGEEPGDEDADRSDDEGAGRSGDEGRSQDEGMVVASDAAAAAGVQTRVAAEDWPLVQPSQIVVSAPPVLTAERILTPLEQIRRKDLEVREALAAKEGLVADLLSIPREHYHTIADMACDTAVAAPRDLAERVMASMFQVDLLQKAVNDALNVTEADSIEAKGGKPVCASQEVPDKPKIPSVPASVIKDIAASLSSQLISLLNDVKQVEEERDRLRREVDRFREQIHEQYHLHDNDGDDDHVAQDDEPADNTEADKAESEGAADKADEDDTTAKGCDKEEVFYETSSDNQ